MSQIDCLAFGPHPDDIELFCSGVLIKLKEQGFTTAVADLSGGELSSNGDIKTRLAEAEQAKEILDSQGEQAVETKITVFSPQVNSMELLEPTADREGLAFLTHLSGGSVVEADQAADVLDFFGSGTRRYTEQTRQTLWDTWPLLAVMVLLLTFEWVIRKRGGLI